MDDWFDRAFSERTVDTNTLPAGDHQIVVEYYEGAVDARVKALIQEVLPPDGTAPNATIATPTNEQVVTTSSVSMTGTTTDNVAVGTVDVGIQNTATSQWLQGDGTFGPAFATRNATLDTPGATSANWSLSVTLPDGSFLASVGATDAATNVDATRATRNFSVNTTPADTQPADGTITFPSEQRRAERSHSHLHRWRDGQRRRRPGRSVDPQHCHRAVDAARRHVPGGVRGDPRHGRLTWCDIDDMGVHADGELGER